MFKTILTILTNIFLPIILIFGFIIPNMPVDRPHGYVAYGSVNPIPYINLNEIPYLIIIGVISFYIGKYLNKHLK